MRSSSRVALLSLVLLGCAETRSVEPPPAEPPPETPPLTLVREDPTDAPIAGLDEDTLARFDAGDARFELPFRESQGLGPLYIHRACESCHEADGRGPGTVRRLARLEGAPELRFGDVVRPRMTAGAQTPIEAPETGARVEVRLGPPLFARGYVEAIPDETLLEYERRQATRDDGIHGRANRVARASAVELPDWLPRLGRFGLKARIASLPEFVADALLGDMGLTSELRPEELENPDGLTDDARPGVDIDRAEVDLIAEYVRLLAIPARQDEDPEGRALFEAARCAVCHVPSAVTRTDHPVEVLRGVEVSLYSDLLLHDMGEGLADGITEGDADGQSWQTPPLVGLRHQPHLLHDGRTGEVEEAIRLHASEGSEANDSVRRFEALEDAEKAQLIAFVEAL